MCGMRKPKLILKVRDTAVKYGKIELISKYAELGLEIQIFNNRFACHLNAVRLSCFRGTSVRKCSSNKERGINLKCGTFRLR